MAAVGIIYLLLLKPMRVWNKPTFSLAKGRISNGLDDDNLGFVQGFLRENTDEVKIVQIIE